MNGLQKKLGPLKVWQWGLIGVALGAAILIFRGKETPEPTGELFGGTGTGAFGPIDPETGIPYAFQGGGSAGESTAPGETLEQFLEKVGMLQDLFPATEQIEGPETIIERIAPAGVVNTARKQQKEKSKNKHDARGNGKKAAGSGKKGKGKGTTAGGTAAQGGNAHNSAPHPATRGGGAAGGIGRPGQKPAQKKGGVGVGGGAKKGTPGRSSQDQGGRRGGGGGGGRKNKNRR